MPIHPGDGQELPKVTWPRYIIRRLSAFRGGVRSDFDEQAQQRKRQQAAIARIEREAVEVRQAIEGPGITLHLPSVKGTANQNTLADDLMWECIPEPEAPERERLRTRLRKFLVRRI